MTSDWGVEHWSGGDGYAEGFYLCRSIGNGKFEWLQHNGKAERFNTEADAEAARSRVGS